MVAYGKVSLQVPKTNHIETAYHGFNVHINPCDWPKQLQHWGSFAATFKFRSSSYTSTQQTLAHTSISAIFSLSLGTLARSPLQFTEWTQWTDLAYLFVDVILDVYPLCPGDSVLFLTIASFPYAPLMLPKQALQQMRWPKRFEPGNMQLKVIQLEPDFSWFPDSSISRGDWKVVDIHVERYSHGSSQSVSEFHLFSFHIFVSSICLVILIMCSIYCNHLTFLASSTIYLKDIDLCVLHLRVHYFQQTNHLGQLFQEKDNKKYMYIQLWYSYSLNNRQKRCHAQKRGKQRVEL